MNKKHNLFVAGDSFASLDVTQPIGKNWSEILAEKTNSDLINVSRPAASNFAIALQIEWINQHINKNDYVVIFLTDHYRKTLVDLNVETEKDKNLLEIQGQHHRQPKSSVLNYSNNIRLMSSMFVNQDERTKEYYRDWYDADIQEVEDRLVITGALARLSVKTEKFLVCKGGFGFKDGRTITSRIRTLQSTVTVESEIDHSTFSIKKEQFVANCTSHFLTSLSEYSTYVNHMDDITHAKLAAMLKNKWDHSSVGRANA